jgi:hypothetical protein
MKHAASLLAVLVCLAAASPSALADGYGPREHHGGGYREGHHERHWDGHRWHRRYWHHGHWISWEEALALGLIINGWPYAPPPPPAVIVVPSR